MAHPIVLPRTYLLVFGALILLTGTTYLLSGQHLGGWELPMALGIACTKTVLVGLFFMHLLYGSRLTWVVVATGVVFLGIMLVLTMSDYATRGWLPERGAPQPGVRASESVVTP
jgi:cytochrome c oxidase subunit 4